jgi:hypothetical protein
MIHAILLHIVLLHAQMTVPWVGAPVAAAAPTVTNYRPIVLEVGKPLVLRVGTPVVLK